MRTAAAISAGLVGGLCLPALLRCSRRLARAATPAAAEDVALPPARKVKIALCQLTVTADKEQNIASAQKAVKAAASQGAQLVVLPEMWNCPYSNDSFPTYAEDIEGGASPSVAALSQAAREAGVTLVGGSVPERYQGKLYNTCCVFNSQGKLLARHRKVHLFDIDIPGKMTFRESLTLSPGPALTVVETDAGRLGIGICYDIRFPEMAMVYAQQGCQLLVYPGAFNTTTGPLHWELLLRARAVDNQLFVAACSPARNPGSSYQAWGHSTVVGPFAEVLATTGHEEDMVFADMDYCEIEERRSMIPVRVQKRLDLYRSQDLGVQAPEA
ncbi:carbon-nitrogen hydrolase [Haematococcus lacustris]